MKLEPIEASTSVAATGHDPETNVMYIQFTRGDIYAYPGVTAEGHAKLRAAKSVGGFLNKMNVKGVKVPKEKTE